MSNSNDEPHRTFLTLYEDVLNATANRLADTIGFIDWGKAVALVKRLRRELGDECQPSSAWFTMSADS